MAISRFVCPLPRTVDNASANTIAGKASITSTIRIINVSTAPPRYPEIMPRSVPINALINIAVTDVISEILEPRIIRLKISLPR